MITALGHRRIVFVAIASSFACAPDSGQLPLGVPVASLQVADEVSDGDGDGPRFSAWSDPVNLGPMVNSMGADMNPVISRTGLSLYFASDRSGVFGTWVSQRTSVDQPWGVAQPTPVDRANQPALSLDEHRLFFNSARPGGAGGQDLWVSRRHDKRDDFGWQDPLNLGTDVNTDAAELGPALFEDGRNNIVVMYFASNRAGGLGGSDIYASTRRSDDSFGPPVLVEELSSSSDDNAPVIRRDGLEIVISSNRPGSASSGLDLWVSTRASTSHPWSAPVNLGAVVNSNFVEEGAALSGDGTELYFHSNANRPGRSGPCFGDLGPCFFDVYVSTRRKLKGSN